MSVDMTPTVQNSNKISYYIFCNNKSSKLLMYVPIIYKLYQFMYVQLYIRLKIAILYHLAPIT